MPKKNTFQSTQEFIDAAIIIHGNKYDYNKFNYKDMSHKSTITCHLHGDFEQCPEKHIKRKQGCSMCGGTTRSTTKEFLELAETIHGKTYDYSLVDYKNRQTSVVIICKEHGEFLQSPSAHIYQKQGCPTCFGSIKGTTESFIQKAKKVHGELYNYDKVRYVNCKTKVIITCPYHGDFSQTPMHHTNNGSGCKKCNVVGGYSEKFFKNNPESCDIPATLYIVKITDNFNTFYKIGITKRTLDIRFSTTRNMNINVQTVFTFTGPLHTVFTTEQRLLRSLIHKLPKPEDIFIHGGETECFLATDTELLAIRDKVSLYLNLTLPAETSSMNLV